MAEACPDSRRCLPAWMTKPCSSNEASNSDHRKKQVVESGALDQVKPIRRKIKTVDAEDAGELRALQRCKSRENVGRKIKDADHAVKDEFDELEKINWKNVKKVTGRAAPKNSRKQKLENVGSEESSSGITDDEIQVTTGNSRALKRCQGTEISRKKRSVADYAAKDELEEIKKTTRKNITKVTGRAAPKNSRKRKLDNVGSEALSSDTSDDEIELTVDDLVSIAEEIVNADKEKLQDIQTAKTARYEEHPPCPQVSSSADTGGPVSGSWKGLTQCTATTTNKTPSECRADKSSRHEEPQRPPSIQMTGDGAQDMLNILLGPLWSKAAAYKKSEPAAYEKKSEPAAYEKKPEVMEPTTMNVNHAPAQTTMNVNHEPAPTTMNMNHGPAPTTMNVNHGPAPTTMNVNHEPPRPVGKKDWRTVHQVQGELVVAKKKSSLKDMVAMFL